MNKGDLLRQVKEAAAKKIATLEEVTDAYDAGVTTTEKDGVYRRSIAEILSFIGGMVVVLGVAIFISQHWSKLNIIARVLSTLGTGIAFYLGGVIFTRSEKDNLLSQVFFLISGLTVPVGISILFDNAGWDMGSSRTHAIFASILFVTYGCSYLVFKKNIFVIFNIIFGTWLFFSFTDLTAIQGVFMESWRFTAYRILIMGISYALFGYHFESEDREVLSKWIYGIGIIAFLSAALVLGGWSPEQNVFWELLFPGLCFGVMFLSVQLRNKSFLVFGALFLMIYFLKISTEYFSNTLGWPLAVILMGLFLIFVGYGSFSVSKKYFND